MVKIVLSGSQLYQVYKDLWGQLGAQEKAVAAWGSFGTALEQLWSSLGQPKQLGAKIGAQFQLNVPFTEL